MSKISNIPLIKKITCSGHSSYLIDFDGNVWSFGKNDGGQLGLGNKKTTYVPTKIDSLSDIIQVSGSFGSHFLAQDSQNKIYVMGHGDNGQLGPDAFSSKSISIPKELISEQNIWGCNEYNRTAKSARK